MRGLLRSCEEFTERAAARLREFITSVPLSANGLLRQYLPKGTDLSVYSQDDLNQIALSLNTRPRQRHGFHTPLQIYNEHLRLAEAKLGTMH